MKRINYLIVAMLMAFTMVGCQVDLSDYLTKEEADAKYATIAYVDGKVADLETKINDIDAKFADYYTKGEVDEKLEGYATKESLEALSDISKAVKDYLGTVNWNDYIEDGYTNAEIDAKLKAITDITDNLAETYATVENIANLKTYVDNMNTTLVTYVESCDGAYKDYTDNMVANLKTYVDALLSDDSINEYLQNWASANLNGATVDLTDYVKTTDLAGYVKAETLEGYATKDEIPTDYVSTETFNAEINVIKGRLETVEGLISRVATLESELAELKTKVDGKADASGLTNLTKTVTSLETAYNNNTKGFLTSADLVGYLTEANADAKYETIENVTTKYNDLDTRVKTLETILDVKNGTSEIINKLNLAIASIDTNTTNIATLKSELNALNATVTNETDGLVKQIGKATSDINAIENRVATLEGATWTFSDYSEAIINGLATIYATKTELETKANASDIPNMNEYAKKTEVVGLVETYIGQEMGKATSNLKSIFNNVYATKTELASKLDASAIDIENITSRLATLESDKTKVELCPNCYANDGAGTRTYFYYPYIKFTDNNGKVSYMTFLDEKAEYGFIDDNGNLSFNEAIIECHKSGHYEIDVVDSILSKYLPETNN